MLILVLLSCLVLVQPVNDFLALVNHCLPFTLADLVLHLVILHCCPHIVCIALKAVLGCNTITLSIILGLVLLSFIHHSLDVVSTQTTLVVCNSDLVLLTRTLVDSRDIEDTIGINIKRDLNLRHTTRRRRYSSQLKLA